MPSKAAKQVRLPTKSIATIFGASTTAATDVDAKPAGSKHTINKILLVAVVGLLVALFVAGIAKGGIGTDVMIVIPPILLGAMFYHRETMMAYWDGTKSLI